MTAVDIAAVVVLSAVGLASARAAVQLDARLCTVCRLNPANATGECDDCTSQSHDLEKGYSTVPAAAWKAGRS